ncbi:hypothetical protein [Bradyrhizobium sp. Ai1a-2]|uniref:hypothetical protein n=1 Tax=Bradyrhizobium sp. Ai1a-2 TaxID=196490 RepID=UPI0003F59DCD|nr:hypothetical protein [Bradyrhizobium sp. Ai1a-2]
MPGPHGFTVRRNIARLRAADRSQAGSLPCDHISRATLPRPPHPDPTFVTMANAPLSGRDGEVLVLIWGWGEAVYFCAEDWTRQIALMRLKKFARA